MPVAVMPNGEHCSDSGYCDLAQLSSAEIRRIIACPSALVEAPIAIVWGLLMATAEWGRFCDIRVLSVDPPGPARPGQRLVGLTGPRFLPLRVVFDFTEIDAERHHIRMEGRLPFGLKVSENH